MVAPAGLAFAAVVDAAVVDAALLAFAAETISFRLACTKEAFVIRTEFV